VKEACKPQLLPMQNAMPARLVRSLVLLSSFIRPTTLSVIAAAALAADAGPAAAPNSAHTDALLHDTFDARYRSPGGPVTENTTVKLRLRTAVGSADTVTLRVYRYDAASDSTELIDMPMSLVPRQTSEGRVYDFYQVIIRTPAVPSILYYKFRLTGSAGDVWYSDDVRFPGDDSHEGGEGAPYPNEPFPSFQLTVYDSAFATPEWLHDAVVYQIFPDRFRNGDRRNDPCRSGSPAGCPLFYDSAQAVRHEMWNEPVEDPRQSGVFNRDFFGGDLAGIEQKLDYIQRLGVNTLYLNPVFAARSNHRYDTDDYHRVDPSLGGNRALESLVAALRRRGMHLILDGVFNHASSDGRLFDRYHRYRHEGACESTTSPFRSWFRFTTDNVPCGDFDYEAFLGLLPIFDHGNPDVRDFFYRTGHDSVLGRWYAGAADGWRFDAAQFMAHDWWRDLRPFAKSYKPDGPLIGEAFTDASQFLLGDQLDSVMNYRFMMSVLAFVRSSDWGDNVLFVEATPPSLFDHALAAAREDYPPQALAAMLNLIDSHDTNRALFMYTEEGDNGLTEAKERLRLAALLQFTYAGAPMVFYGDEAAIDAPALASGEFGPTPDPYVRAPYPWRDESGDPDLFGPADTSMISYYRALGKLRAAHTALRRGSFETLLTGDTTPGDRDDGTYAFARSDQSETVVVALNKSGADNSASIPVARYFRDGTWLHDPISGVTAEVAGGRVKVTLGPRSALVLLGPSSRR
jgi:glycosidase